MMVHPLDDVPSVSDLAGKLNFKLVSSGPCALVCCCFGGLDKGVDQDAFADEQSLGFQLAHVSRQLQVDGLLCIDVSQKTIWNEEQPLERMVRWLDTFGIADIQHFQYNKDKWHFRGTKHNPAFKIPVHVGVVFSEAKRKKVVTEEFLTQARAMNVHVVTEPSSMVDVVLFKSSTIPTEWSAIPIIVDQPAKVRVLDDRIQSSEIAEKALVGTGVSLPYCCTSRDRIQAFPLVAKPNDASAHAELWFIDSPKGLEQLPEHIDWFFQTCVDHGDTMFKVSVIGKEIAIARRPSAVPSVTGGARKLTRKGDEHPRKKGILFQTVQVGDGAARRQTIVSPSYNLVVDVARRLQQAFDLTLFGFDLLVEQQEDKRVFLVDINYFPSFVDVPEKNIVLMNALNAAVRQSDA